MFDSIMLMFIAIGFCTASLAIAGSFIVHAYLDYQEQQVAIEHGIRIITERNSPTKEADDDDFAD